MERSHSGLVRLFRKQVRVYALRGFDSHPLRQENDQETTAENSLSLFKK